MNKIVEKAKKETEPKRPIFKNAVKAFFTGGLICLIGQILIEFFKSAFTFDNKTASIYAILIVVFIASLLTGLGIYDKFGQFAGAGTIIPISGFSNSMTSAALESKSEGVVLGIFTNMFKLAGSVIVVGVISAFIFGTIRYLLGV
jgi:stage V sporulation protein AC